MPIYEYRCKGCNRRLSIYVKGFSSPLDPTCSWCGSKELKRIYSSFLIRKSERLRSMDAYDDILSDERLVRGLETNDPRALAEWSRRMGQGLDEESPPEMEEMLGRMEAGEPLENIMGGEEGEEED